MRTGAILLRVSSKRQAAEDKTSYTVQLEACQKYAKEHDIEVPTDLIWQEVGERGQFYTRDGLQAALRAAEAGRYQALIVWRLDRLTDDIGNFLRILDTLKRHGALPWSATEPDVDLSTPDGLWYVHTKLHFQVAPERKTTATRSQENRRQYTLQGRPWASHRARYGYQWIVDPARTVRRFGIDIPLKEKLEPDPETGPVMQRMYNWVDEGRTLKWVARALSGLEDGGIYKTPTPRQYEGMNGANEKGEWNETSISRMLEYPGYMGKWPAYRTKRKARNDGSERARQERVPEEDWVWVEPSPVTHPLVTVEQWRRVQQRLSTNKLYSRRNSTPLGADVALLHTGMARCGLCGGPMEAKMRSHSFDYPDGSRRYQYQCRASRRNFPACVGMYVAAETLDRAVQVALYDTLRSPETIRRLAQRSLDADLAKSNGVAIITPMDEARDLSRKVEAKKRELQNLTLRSAAYAPGDPALSGYDLAISALGSEVARLEEDAARASRAAKKFERVEAAVHEWEDYIGLWRDNIAWMSNAYYLSSPWQRQTTRGWLESLGARVIVNPHDASKPLATLQLHLTRLDLKAKETGALDVPVTVVAPEPLRHGGERPDWLRADYVETPSEDQLAEHPDYWAKLEQQLFTPEGVAERHGWTLEEATAYLDYRAAMEAEAEALPESERWEYWLTHTLPRPFEWIAAYRAGDPTVLRSSIPTLLRRRG